MKRSARPTWPRHVLLVLGAAVTALPLYLAVVVASRPASALLVGVPVTPGRLLFANLGHVLREGLPDSPPVWRMLVNSFEMALAISLGKIALSVPAAFAVVFFRFRGRMLAFWLIFVTLMLPIEVRFYPTYKVTADLGLLNGLPGLVLPLIASATATFLFRQFFLTFPPELADAARVDGCGPVRYLVDVVLPLSKVNLAAIFVLEFIYGWNQYLWPLLVTTSPSQSTIVMGMKEMISAAQSFSVPEWNLVMAVALVALVPPVVVVVVMQRWFVKGLTAGIT
jgi:sn-glycerol 3-phosphate transport system permease protein